MQKSESKESGKELRGQEQASDPGERQADASSRRTAKAAARVVAEVVCKRGLVAELRHGKHRGSRLYFKKMTGAVMWCPVSGVAKSKAQEQNERARGLVLIN